MTEIFVSGTEVFSDAKMTESPYEWRMFDMYVTLYIILYLFLIPDLYVIIYFYFLFFYFIF